MLAPVTGVAYAVSQMYEAAHGRLGRSFSTSSLVAPNNCLLTHSFTGVRLISNRKKLAEANRRKFMIGSDFASPR
jgi:hypothetical protein